MKTICAAIAICLSTPALAQFVLPAAELHGVPSGTTQKVVAAGYLHSGTHGGNQITGLFGQGGNEYDRTGNIFEAGANEPYCGQGGASCAAVPIYLLNTANGTKTTFGTLAKGTCTVENNYSVIVNTQLLTGISFNTVRNQLEIATQNVNRTFTFENGGAVCPVNTSDPTVGGGISDETDAYIVVTGPNL